MGTLLIFLLSTWSESIHKNVPSLRTHTELRQQNDEEAKRPATSASDLEGTSSPSHPGHKTTDS